ncbi:MAG: hypothetical protein GY749_20105 [Desulfobacteraceae bacterium]|nr:hypothetical protein [Desulfobacteraceae bacterium]
MKRQSALLIYLIVSLFSFADTASAQTLTIGSVRGKQGDTVEIPITFTNDAENVCAIEFKIVFDASLAEYKTISPGVSIEGFLFGCHDLDGKLQINILKIHLEPIPSGKIAVLTMNIIELPGIIDLKLDEVVFSDIKGENEIEPVALNNGSISTPWIPTANAGTDQNIYEGKTVALDSAGSSSPPGYGELSYQWNQTSGTSVTLSDPTSANPVFTAPHINTETELLIFELTATNSDGYNKDSVTVTVMNTVPVLSITPLLRNVPTTSGTATFEIANIGTGTTDWTATTDDSWLTITSGSTGTDNGTITVSYQANPGETRIGKITVTASEPENTTHTIKLLQDPGSLPKMETNTNNNLRDIWGNSGTDIFAVGEKGTILHYDGSTWTAMASNSYNYLRSVWGRSGNNVFAVGENGTILHYNGTDWTRMTSTTSDDLEGVWGSSGNDVFAVSKQGSIFHYNGNTWTQMPQSTLCPLYDIWGTPSDNVFAAGGTWNSFVILRYNGSAWAQMPVSTSDVPYSLWGTSENNVFAVGNSGAILHYGGREWQKMETVSSDYLRSVWGTSGNNVFAVGVNGTVLQYNGAAWRQMPAGSSKDLYGIWGSAENDVYAVGNSGTILHYSPPILSVSPVIRQVPAASGETPFEISNTGTGSMAWIAMSDASWITINSGSSGTDQGTVVAAYEPNNRLARKGTITIIAPGAINNPLTVEINQDKVLKGDIDGNGVVDLRDTIMALKVLAGISQGDVSVHADADGDGKIGMEDVIYTLRNVAM